MNSYCRSMQSGWSCSVRATSAGGATPCSQSAGAVNAILWTGLGPRQARGAGVVRRAARQPSLVARHLSACASSPPDARLHGGREDGRWARQQEDGTRTRCSEWRLTPMQSAVSPALTHLHTAKHVLQANFSACGAPSYASLIASTSSLSSIPSMPLRSCRAGDAARMLCHRRGRKGSADQCMQERGAIVRLPLAGASSRSTSAGGTTARRTLTRASTKVPSFAAAQGGGGGSRWGR